VFVGSYLAYINPLLHYVTPGVRIGPNKVL